mmetsp:Transcript_35533/g.43548  ORF Transcript_35533/g.43548 Transcript_35533/m.43548 type:complete len:144 (-) Transcript_35533:233-664(-)|eukprot:CAMPEP_0170465758 /NCGR_PEP_ID=MMETSP0123-20130129/9979_1 /TAXON_ID=182087 /ORGANISM="Favella ehrenbergii, Strain Fehren 1" /LENGTH=143 /DNA_ID=CAMNT_0010731729 /DNA_START=31 /DNA_END=462 /DNA_ORIENTATION=+
MFDSPDQMVAFLKGARDPAYLEAMQQIEDGLATVTDQDPEEVLATVKEMMEAVFVMVKDMLDKVFSELDANGDGVVDSAELRAKAQSEEEYNKLINSELFTYIDKNGDNQLSRDEIDGFVAEIRTTILASMDDCLVKAKARRA